MQAIESVYLVKVYGDGVKALHGIDISIKKGEFYTLLGLNGAGKTTFVRIISTQLLPTSGECYVLGYDVVREASEVCKRIAVVPQDAVTYGSYTAWDYAYYFSRLRGTPREEAKKAAEKALRTVKMWDLRKKLCSTISGGERKRAIIASALASDADVLLLDETTSGLDAIAKRSVLSSLGDLTREGKTIILTTHNMEEAETASDRVGIINKGKMVAEGSPEEIKNSMKKRYRVVLNGGPKVSKNFDDCVKIGDKYIVYVLNEDEATQIMREALKKGLQASVSPITLEDAFIKLVGES